MDNWAWSHPNVHILTKIQPKTRQNTFQLVSFSMKSRKVTCHDTVQRNNIRGIWTLVSLHDYSQQIRHSHTDTLGSACTKHLGVREAYQNITPLVRVIRIAPYYGEAPLLRHSDIRTCVMRGSHSFTCHPHTNYTCLYSPAARHHRRSPLFGWYSLHLPTKGWRGWNDLGGWSHTEISVPHRELNP